MAYLPRKQKMESGTGKMVIASFSWSSVNMAFFFYILLESYDRTMISFLAVRNAGLYNLP